MLDEVGRIKTVIPEIARERTRCGVGARLGHDVQHRTQRAALCGIKPVIEELKFRKGISAERGVQTKLQDR